jgi:hypothetical protein
LSFTFNGLTYKVIVSTTGKTWLDRNLGATQVATSSTDIASYGDLYQWGRGADGHQIRTPLSTNSVMNATSATDNPGSALFIIVDPSSSNWRSGQNNTLWQGVNGINNPCPTGYRVPTYEELNTEKLAFSLQSSASSFGSLLKLPAAGVRSSKGSLMAVGSFSMLWSSTLSGSNAFSLITNSTGRGSNGRAFGCSVRCLKD